MAPRGASSRGEMDSARCQHSPTPFLQRGSWATTQRAPGSQGWDVGEAKQGQGCQVTWQITPLLPVLMSTFPVCTQGCVTSPSNSVEPTLTHHLLPLDSLSWWGAHPPLSIHSANMYGVQGTHQNNPEGRGLALRQFADYSGRQTKKGTRPQPWMKRTHL